MPGFLSVEGKDLTGVYNPPQLTRFKLLLDPVGPLRFATESYLVFT